MGFTHTYRVMGIHNHMQKLTGQTLFRLVYDTKVVMSMEYIVPSFWIIAMTGMADCEALKERLAQLEELEEE